MVSLDVGDVSPVIAVVRVNANDARHYVLQPRLFYDHPTEHYNSIREDKSFRIGAGSVAGCNEGKVSTFMADLVAKHVLDRGGKGEL